mmetsp:Transcript_11547/g.31575  ORF Transcript_11547/g.31575 Transcript_11547/m.31575 type:complete len:115 (+) Transcript_11547:124-468(+)
MLQHCVDDLFKTLRVALLRLPSNGHAVGNNQDTHSPFKAVGEYKTADQREWVPDAVSHPLLLVSVNAGDAITAASITNVALRQPPRRRWCSGWNPLPKFFGAMLTVLLILWGSV